MIRGENLVFTDADLSAISEANPGWQCERSDSGALLISPTSTTGGRRSAKALVQLYLYAERFGGAYYDSSTGFATPAGGVVSPDASWVNAERVACMDASVTYQVMMPDIAIEVASESDAWPALLAKIDKYIADGARYAIAINPKNRTTYARGTPPSGFDLDVDAIIDA